MCSQRIEKPQIYPANQYVFSQDRNPQIYPAYHYICSLFQLELYFRSINSNIQKLRTESL